MGDVIRPLKRQLPGCRRVEDGVMRAICARFGLGAVCPQSVKDADMRILHDERDVLLSRPAKPWLSLEGVSPLGVDVQCWSPEEAERRWLARLDELRSAAAAGLR